MPQQERTPGPDESQAAAGELYGSATEYLESVGLRILDRNWRCADGQIDIVATEDGTLVVCTVRTCSAGGPPAPAMSRASQSKLRRLAARWLVTHGLLFDEVRVDVVCLLRERSGSVAVEHYRGVG